MAVDRLRELRRAGGGGAPAALPTAEAHPIDVGRDSIEVAALVPAAAQRSDDAGGGCTMPAAGDDVETAALAGGSAAALDMDSFFRNVADVKAQLAELRRHVGGLAKLFQLQRAEFDPAAQRRAGSEIETTIVAIQRQAARCQSHLRLMQRETDSIEAALAGTDFSDSSELRARRNIASALGAAARSLVEEFLALQTTHQSARRETVSRQVEIAVGGSASADDKAQIVEECIEEVRLLCCAASPRQ